MASENGRFPWEAWINEQRTEALVCGALFLGGLLIFVLTGLVWAGVVAFFALFYGLVSAVFTLTSVAIRKMRGHGLD